LSSSIVISSQFRGPPNSGNGGYVCGLLAARIEGPATVMLRAPIPLDTPLLLVEEDGVVRLTAEDGTLIGEARPADATGLTEVPAPPPLASVAAAFRGWSGVSIRSASPAATSWKKGSACGSSPVSWRAARRD